ncbi:uncharacterized protein LOC144118316 [Amblyomma americanum]
MDDSDWTWDGDGFQPTKRPKLEGSSSTRKSKRPRQKGSGGDRSRAKPRERSKHPLKKNEECGAKRGRRGRDRVPTKEKKKLGSSAVAQPPPGTTMECGHVPNTEEEPPAVYNEDLLEDLAREYLETIKPDLSTVVRLKGRDSSLTSHSRRSRSLGYVDTTKRRRASSEPAKRSGRTRTMSSPAGTCTVAKLPPGPLAELLPAGTIVRRPPGKLVQLVAQAIHESPLQVLRVRHVYEALKKRYPYFMFMDKKDETTWKSSVRHALSQRWFKKVHTHPPDRNAAHGKSNFWEINYHNRPRGWAMPEEEEMSSTGFGESPEPTPSVWSQDLDMELDLLPPLQSPPPQQQACTPYQVLLSPQTAMQRQQPPVARPMPTHSSAPTLQSSSAEPSLMSPLYMLHMSPPAWCTGMDEIPVGSELGPLCAQEKHQEQEAVMPQEQSLPRLGPSNSQEGTLPHPELPLPPQFPWPPQEPPLPGGPTSPPRQEETGPWGTGPGFRPRSGRLQLPGWPYVREPVFAAIANPRRAVMMEDGTWYILVYPAFAENDECLVRAVWHWEEGTPADAVAL